jgi:hypothetical protein
VGLYAVAGGEAPLCLSWCWAPPPPGPLVPTLAIVSSSLVVWPWLGCCTACTLRSRSRLRRFLPWATAEHLRLLYSTPAGCSNSFVIFLGVVRDRCVLLQGAAAAQSYLYAGWPSPADGYGLFSLLTMCGCLDLVFPVPRQVLMVCGMWSCVGGVVLWVRRLCFTRPVAWRRVAGDGSLPECCSVECSGCS